MCVAKFLSRAVRTTSVLRKEKVARKIEQIGLNIVKNLFFVVFLSSLEQKKAIVPSMRQSRNKFLYTKETVRYNEWKVRTFS
jgi:hypothetical protein